MSLGRIVIWFDMIKHWIASTNCYLSGELWAEYDTISVWNPRDLHHESLIGICKMFHRTSPFALSTDHISLDLLDHKAQELE